MWFREGSGRDPLALKSTIVFNVPCPRSLQVETCDEPGSRTGTLKDKSPRPTDGTGAPIRLVANACCTMIFVTRRKGPWIACTRRKGAWSDTQGREARHEEAAQGPCQEAHAIQPPLRQCCSRIWEETFSQRQQLNGYAGLPELESFVLLCGCDKFFCYLSVVDPIAWPRLRLTVTACQHHRIYL